MKILQINTDGTGSGAARAMLQLHAGLCQLGHTSRVLVARQPGDVMDVQIMPRAKTLSRKLRRSFRRSLIDWRYKLYTNRPDGYEGFSSHQSEFGAEPIQEFPDCEVINLHWISGFIDYSSFFRWAVPHVPVVWTLHDMNAFTGGCHYDDGCGKYQKICGACPQLGSQWPDDLSYQIWKKKHSILTEAFQGHLHLVTPSRWLAQEVQNSALLKDCPVSVIPNSVDNAIFTPRGKDIARQALEIPQEARVVLFVAGTMTIKRKGLQLLAQALESIQTSKKLYLLSVGAGKLTLPVSLPHIHLGYVNHDRLLALVYSAADVFVISSLQENLPNTVLESMACGIPVVGFDVGGIPDMIRPGSTGLLVPPGDVQSLGQAILKILEDRDLNAAYSVNCRKVVEQEYTPQTQARRYVELYQQLVTSD